MLQHKTARADANDCLSHILEARKGVAGCAQYQAAVMYGAYAKRKMQAATGNKNTKNRLDAILDQAASTCTNAQETSNQILFKI